MPPKLRIAFHAAGNIPFHGKSLEERPLGGTETGIIRLAESLNKRGHEVVVFSAYENPPETNPKYFHVSEINDHGKFDIVVIVQNWKAAFATVPAKHRFFLTGDGPEQYLNYGIGDRRTVNLFTKLLTVSNWQAKTLCAHSGFPIEKTWYIGNGIHPEYFKKEVEKKRKRLIYSSSPNRGLKFIPDLYNTLIKKHPDLEIHIFSSAKMYSGYAAGEAQLAPIVPEIVSRLKELPNCHYHESTLQKDLAKEFMKSSILFYPCDFPETSCITAIEAQAAGCAVLSSNYCALPETVADAGILIRGKPGSSEYLRSYLAAADILLSDDELLERLSKRGKERVAKHYHWDHVAERFEAVLENLEI